MSYFSNFRKKDFTIDGIGTVQLTNIAMYSKMFAKLADDVTLYSYYTFVNGDRLDVISEKLYGTPEYYWTFILINPEIVNTYRDLPKEYNSVLLDYIKQSYTGIALKLAAGESLVGKFELNETVSFNVVNKGTVIAKYPTLGYIEILETEGSFPINQPFTLVGETSGDTIQIANKVEMYNAPHHFENADGEWVRWDAGQVTPVTILEYEIEQNDLKSQIKVIRPEQIYNIAQAFKREMSRQ